MTVPVGSCIAIATVAIVLAAAAIIWQRRRHGRSMNRLMEMLDAAMNGTFAGRSYDETLLSAVESRMDDYLSASAVAARSLESEKETIKQLISDISHQTKTPLSNIMLYAQLLGERELPRESGECVRALLTQAEKLEFLIAALVKLSRLETGILTMHPQKNAVQPLLEEIRTRYAPRAEERGVALDFEPVETEAVFDSKWTAEALSNLVDNAIKYTPAGGSVQLSATAYQLFCRIDVKDTGMGIPEEEHAKIFARFYRSTAVSLTEGVGVGLYLARQILTGQGGYIRVRSQVGAGSVFSIFLPRAP